MTTDVTNSTAEPLSPPETFAPLSLNERRVLGVLVEKAKTTPDVYPLTLNSLITGCNQKSNRDPVLNLTDVEVEDALNALKKRGLAQQITGGGRVDKYRHILYDAWHVDKAQLAILGELLLRGPQSEGDVRTRASRMEPIADLDELRPHLRALSQRGLVVYLTPEGRRGTMVTHGFHPPDELAGIRARVEKGQMESAPSPVSDNGRAATATSEWPQRVLALETAVQELRQEMARLQQAVAELRDAEVSRSSP